MSHETYLLVKGHGGLGDRIQSLLTAFLYARLSGRRLVVDWSDSFYAAAGENVFPLYFHSPLYDPTIEIRDTCSVSPPIWRGHLHESVRDLRSRYDDRRRRNVDDIWLEFSIDPGRLDYDTEVAVLWVHTAQGDRSRPHLADALAAFADADNDTILRQLLRDNLRLHPRLQERVAEFERRAFRRPTVGVHVRYTDYRASLGAILWRLRRLVRREPGLQVFLATDNERIKRLFEIAYPSVITAPHWYPAKAGRSLHRSLGRPDPTERGAEALVDLYLLAACDYLIVDPGSSFGRVATLLSQAQGTNVFSVFSRGDLPPLVHRWSYRVMRLWGYPLWLHSGMFDWGLGGLTKLWRLATRR
jgi:hypothetical protein